MTTAVELNRTFPSSLLTSNIQHQSPIPSMSRPFSTTMRALLDVIWKNTPAKPEYDAMITRSIETHPKLSKWAQRVEVAWVTQIAAKQAFCL